MDVSSSGLPTKVVIAGGTGFLGQLLAKSFANDGIDVVLLSRQQSSKVKYGRVVRWDAKTIGTWVDELEESSVLINLTGRSVDCRHNHFNREEILDSRIQSTRLLGEALNLCKQPPALWLNASSMALYGQCWGDSPAHTEDSPLQSGGFLEDVTVAWENEFFKSKRAGVRQVAFRISFILGRRSGAFPLLKKLTQFGLGGHQGSGQQWMSWLHEEDWVGIVRFLCHQDQNHVSGSLNLSAPSPVTNKDFMHQMRREFAPLGLGFWAPAFGVRIGCFLLGSSPELALQSRKVIPQTLMNLKYPFVYSQLEEAVCSLA
jgi:uncharacterized protein (TIGR01777 family)